MQGLLYLVALLIYLIYDPSPILMALSMLAGTIHFHWSKPSSENTLLTGEERRAVTIDRSGFHCAKPDVVIHSEKPFYNRRGMTLHTQTWMPKNDTPKALICFNHGYGGCTNWFGFKICETLAEMGYIVAALDYEGHGRSDGLWVCIEDFDTIVDDCHHYFSTVQMKMKRRWPDISTFVMGESMGGAVAILLTRNYPDLAKGMILCAPMVKIADDAKPHPVITKVLQNFAYLAPRATLTPSKSLTHIAFSNGSPWFSHALKGPFRWRHRHRLGTAMELLRVSTHIEETLHEVTMPFMVVHGDSDRITDPAISQALYDNAGSSDKTIKLYPGAPHAILSDECRHDVFKDIQAWIDSRV